MQIAALQLYLFPTLGLLPCHAKAKADPHTHTHTHTHTRTHTHTHTGFHPLAKDCHIKHPEDPIKTLYELPPAGFLQIFITIGFIEFLSLKIKENPTYAAGVCMCGRGGVFVRVRVNP